MSKNPSEIPSVEELRKSLAERPEIQAYLARYNKHSRDSFLRSYAHRLHHTLEWGAEMKKWQEARPMKHMDNAESHFWEIQQKKLFDIQCQWRAELIQLEGIESTFDFEHWEKHIETCPYLSPVSQEEFELYVSYVKSSHFEFEDHLFHQYQGYYAFKVDPEDGESLADLPPWYQYHNLMTGTNGLLLPDIRGAKEERYMDVARKHNREKAEAEHPARTAEEIAESQKPFISSSEEEILALAAKVESPELLKDMKAGIAENKFHADLEDVIMAIHYLGETKERFAFEPGLDWRQQVLQTEKRRKSIFMLEALHIVFSDYQLRQQLGLGYHLKEDGMSELEKQLQKTGNGIRHLLKDLVMQGRQILGEPKDWNF